MSDIRHVLTTARALLAAGWHQGGNTDGHGNVCVRAAIGLAAGLYEMREDGGVGFPVRSIGTQGWDWHTEMAAVSADYEALAKVSENLPTPYTSIPVWNDDPHTTITEVLAVMDKAIDAC